MASCNDRLIRNPYFEVGRKVWGSISKFGVIGKVDIASSIKVVEAMEMRDKEGKVGRKAALTLLP